MNNISELYVLEEPIDTSLGKCRFFKVREYHKLIAYGSLLNLDKNSLLNKIYGKIDDKLFDTMIDKNYLEIIKESDFLLDIYNAYKELFDSIFDKIDIDSKIDLILAELEKRKIYSSDALLISDIQKNIYEYTNYKKLCVFDRIQNDKELMEYCKLIKEMNCIKDEDKECSSELAYYDKLSQIVKEKKGDILTFRSLVLNVGLYRQDVLEMSIYNLYAYFDTISNNKNYDTGNLFKTVSTERIYVKPWYTDNSIKSKTELSEEDKDRIGNHMGEVREEHENGIKQNI